MGWFALSLVGLASGIWHLVTGWRARSVGFLQLPSPDGKLHGKWISWRTRALGGVVITTASIAVMWLTPWPGSTGDFVFTHPTGWTGAAEALREGRAPAGWDSEEVRTVTAQSASFAFVADADRISMFSAEIMKKTGAVTRAELQAFVVDLTPVLEKRLSATSTVDESGIVEVRDTWVGRHKMTFDMGDRRRVVLLFLLPGASSRANVTYGADAEDFEGHLPEVMASVEAAVGSAKRPVDLPFAPGYLVILAHLGAVLLVFIDLDHDHPAPTTPASKTGSAEARSTRKRKKRKRSKDSDEAPGERP